MADEEEDDAPDSEEPASEKPKAEEKKKVEPKKADKSDPPPKEPTKPVSKSVEWAIAIAMMLLLAGILYMMIAMMRNARSAIM